MLVHPKYRPDIDGLRAIAVLLVVGYHAFPGWVKGGFIGVDIFFVISGYLITTIIIGGFNASKFTYLEFYAKRVARIFPALVVVLVFSIVVGWNLFLAADYQTFGKHIVAASTFSSNVLLWSESGYFDADANRKPLLHLWSLAVEEQFYLLWPIIIGVFYKNVDRHYVFVGLIALIAMSFLLNIYIVESSPTAAFYSPLSRFWELLIGGLISLPVIAKSEFLNSSKRYLSAIGVGFLSIAVLLIDDKSLYPGFAALLPTAGTALIILGGAQSAINRYILSVRYLVWIGLISYPLYLWHWPLLSFARIAEGQELAREIRVSIVLLSIAMAWLTYKYIERPIRFSKVLSVRELVMAFMAVGCIGIGLIVNNGIVSRPVNSDEAKLLVHKYEVFKKNGISGYYREECDFYNWTTTKSKDSIHSDCVPLASDRTIVLLWGDSHAQGLSFGVRNNLPPGSVFAQIATSGCRASIVNDPTNGATKESCESSNTYAIEYIKSNRPRKVIVAQAFDHEKTDWNNIAEFVRDNGGELILVGPVPQWRPSLPAIVGSYFPLKKDRVGDGLDQSAFLTDNRILQSIDKNYIYYSIIGKLCNSSGCIARIDSTDDYDLLVMDYGHLTPSGSKFVVRSGIADLLE
jgi:peptidoglycan/LPS O-acetylase OafA/YrhL